MPGITMLGVQGEYQSSGIFLEVWASGQKVTVTGTAARTAALPTAAVRVRNKTSARVWVRTDDGTAADDGTAVPLDSGETDSFYVSSTDGTISLLGTAGNTGSVYLMPAMGSR
jgi:hypothetical protein